MKGALLGRFLDLGSGQTAGSLNLCSAFLVFEITGETVLKREFASVPIT